MSGAGRPGRFYNPCETLWGVCQEREQALAAVAMLYLLHRNGAYSSERAREALELGSVEAIQQQFKDGELPEWRTGQDSEDRQNTQRRKPAARNILESRESLA